MYNAFCLFGILYSFCTGTLHSAESNFQLGAILVEHKHFKLIFDYEHTNIDIMHGEINYFWSRNIVAVFKLKRKEKKTRKKINNFQ